MRREGRAEMFGTNVWNSNNINHSQLLMSACVSLCVGICVSVTQLLHLPGINPRIAHRMQSWEGKNNAQWNWFVYPLLVKECLCKSIQCARGALCKNSPNCGDMTQLFVTKLLFRFSRFIYKVANRVCYAHLSAPLWFLNATLAMKGYISGYVLWCVAKQIYCKPALKWNSRLRKSKKIF